MIPHPASFHTLCAVSRNTKVSGLVMTSRPSWPFWRRSCEKIPAPPNSCWKTAMTSTQEKKCGRYRMACATALTRGLITLLMSSASRTGIGKNSTSWRKKSTRVFFRAFQNAESSMIRWKFSSPTRGLFSIETTPLSLM